ncbi:probable histone-lysine N-methyltransferase Mes-4 [Drosophila santomea]|uniref:probable histone-lysine N-methyltransferase Mes-4 n=1 Tax=Drosophila santomea TaxID=129105 RepID=UPI001953907A|nr:probable histone-lysine N-methyltransferase Mes-4 [Drosophila santomea]
MKLSTDAHSEIEGDVAHGNVLSNSASDSLAATDEVAAGNDESVATEGDDVEIPKDATNSTPIRRLVKPHPGQNSEQPAGEESELENQRRTPVQKQQQQRLSMVNRKRDLINLQSALSPKYIGYANANSPTPLSDSDDTIRTTRRRINQAAALNNSSSAAETLSRDNASPRTTGGGGGGGGGGSANQLLSKTYMSPIEKLLIKNGASSPNSTGFEADSEDLAIRPPVRKQLKRKMKRMSKSKVSLDLEPEKLDEEKPVKTEPLDIGEVDLAEEAPNQEVETPEISIKPETEAENEAAVEDVPIKQEDATSLVIVSNIVETTPIVVAEEPKELEKSTKELTFALPLAASTEVDLKSPPDLSSSALATSIKSPSSVSIDSAKGLSIVTDPGWPTYQVGDLFWGKVFSYCFWPCMVCPDPLGQIVGNMPSHPQRSSLDNAIVPIQVHVRFFADNGRRNWIKPENLLTFAGLKVFEDQREEVRIKNGPKSAKYRQMVPKRTKVLIWRQAIEEAQAMAEIPYSDRLEKFYQIYENAVTLNRQKRNRTKSMMQDTSDVGSSLYDSTDNLHNKQATHLLAVKRERSESPFSPAFSPLKSKNEKRAKRRKLSNGTEADTGSTSMAVTPSQTETTLEKIHSPDGSIYENPEFRQLFDAVKEYVMVHRSEEKVEKVLLAVVSNIWSLKQIQLRELERDLASGEMEEPLGSSVVGRGNGVGTIKRLSNRLKTMMVRRSMTPVVTPSTTPAPSEPERRLAEAPKPKKPVNRPIEEVVEDILQLDSKYLFRGLGRDPICKYCYQAGTDLVRCSRSCSSWLHPDCLERKETGAPMPKIGSRKALVITPTSKSPSPDEEHVTADGKVAASGTSLVCHECNVGEPEGCVICHQVESPAVPSTPMKEEAPSHIPIEDKLLTCSQPLCGKRFHTSCCKYWPQANSSKHSARCPRHVCHTCVSDDPSGKFQQLGSSKLAKCVRCPATYHQDSHCIPAGTQMLNATHIICPRHNIAKADAHVNVLWCYICVKGGELVCCETCPIAVHAHCRNIPIKTNENYICEECESGRLPLYGEIVWAKFNNFRWWPAIILPPTEVPSNILKKAHGENDFVVRFFGTHDHGWISRRRVYLYIEGDTGDGHKTKSQLFRNYTTGVEEASRFLKIIKARRQEQAIGRQSGNKLHPPPYVKIKTNKAVPPVRFTQNLEDLSACYCQPGDEHPCGPDSGCINRMLFNECNPEFCKAGNRCENQMFEQRKSPRLEVVYMNERGFGLVNREPIAEGDFVIEYVGEVINHAEFQRRMEQKQRDRDENYYFLGVEKDFIIDAGPKGNLARFMNHSCEPNCETQKWTVNCIHRVGLFAIKDIPVNTELTFNYLWDDLMNNSKKACFCGATRCSGEIGGKLKDGAVKESNAQTAKGKASAKLKQIRRGKASAVRIHVKAKKAPKVKHISADDEPMEVKNK